MRSCNAGKVLDNLWYLGRKESGVYLLEGSDSSMIISGGISNIVPDILRQFEEFGIDERPIDKLLILHAHFDHIGIVPFFKRRYPNLQIYASQRAWEILHMEKAIDTINAFSKVTAEKMGDGDVIASYDLDWRNDMEGITVGEGDSIDLGNLPLSIMETPGHSSCSISAYAPKIKALFPSDSGGIPYKDRIITSGNSNYTMFQQSLEKLKPLEVECFCADHYGYVTGEEARRFVGQAGVEAKKFRKLMESVYRRTGDIDTAAKRMVSAVIASDPDYFLAPEILESIYRQMLKHIATVMEEGATAKG